MLSLHIFVGCLLSQKQGKRIIIIIMQNFQSQQFKSNPAKVLTISEQILAFHVHRKKKKASQSVITTQQKN